MCMIRMVCDPKYSVITPMPQMSSTIGDMKASPWKHRDTTIMCTRDAVQGLITLLLICGIWL